MNFFEIFLVGLSLSADAFAISVAIALAARRGNFGSPFVFGFFQFIMPLAGFFLSGFAVDFIAGFSRFLAFGILFLLGGKTLVESVSGGGAEVEENGKLGVRVLAAQGLATSLDALAVGVAFRAEGIAAGVIPWQCLVIGAVTFAVCLVGCAFGGKIAPKASKIACAASGAILIAVGLKIFMGV